MAENCTYKNPFKRSGTAQYMRVMDVLMPSNVKIDERTTEDLMLFAKKYASYLNYYNSKNEVEGDWTTFMSLDISVVLATMTKQDVPAYQKFISELLSYIDSKTATTAAGKKDLKNHYKNIYDFTYTLFYFLDECFKQIPEDIEFYDYYKSIIESKLSALYLKLNKYLDAAIANNLINDNSEILSTEVKSPIAYYPYQTLTDSPLGASWYAAKDSTEVLIFAPHFVGANEVAKIKNTIHHNLFVGLIDQIIASFGNIIQTSSIYFERTIDSFPKHSPHYGLFISFLKLFKYAQSSINEFSSKHLDFYYKEVLQLSNNDAISDNVHLVFELTKNAKATALNEGTIFKAGKDADGIALYYSLDDEIVVNAGSLAAVKSLYADSNASTNSLTIYASEVSNSDDGIGGSLTTDDKSWKTFGDASRPFASIGFAVAHPHLFLNEGIRTVQFMFWFNKALTTNDISAIQNLKAKYSSKKGWEDVVISSIVRNFESHECLIINIELGTEAPAVLPYSESIHLSNFDTTLPVFYFEVEDNASLKHNSVSIFENFKMQKIDIYTGVTGLKNINVQNENGVVDPSKPFALFGMTPHIGSSFIFGSNELLLKNKQHPISVNVHFEWDKTDYFIQRIYGENPISLYYDKPIIWSYLVDGEWDIDTSQTALLFDHTHLTIGGVEYHTNIKKTFNLNLPSNSAVEESFDANSPYGVSSKNGYYKIELSGTVDFGHNDYMQRLTQAAIDSGVIPPAPYTPTVKSISLDYSAQGTIELTDTSTSTLETNYGKFFHVTAFGNKYIHPNLVLNANELTLMPSYHHEGELYIGLDKFEANQSVQILFKLADGTADPNLDKQPIEWYYLSTNDNWILFEETSLIDNTNSMTQTGIVKFSFPEDASESKAIIGGSYFWIKAMVKANTAALCNIIQLHPQAATAAFYDYDNNGNYYKSILPESTISKLLVANSSIKSVSQPYTSYNGVAKESDSTFYIRVSERLRHKQRAITIWDYERLVLQKFPEIYKVKALNHTTIQTKAAITVDNEMAPGHVLIVPIPDLNNKNARDPLKPQTDLGTLIAIEHYLRAYTSPHVQLQVKNAKFEEIQLSFKVKFYSDDTAYYHDILLNDIEKYLSPWAYDSAKDVEFGGVIYKSVLINFIEELAYVDYLTCFNMFHIVDGIKSPDTDEAISTSARSLFVSYSGNTAANDPKHIIDYLNLDCNC